MANSRAADNVGTLSVDIVGDLTKLDAALSEVEAKLGKVKSTASIKLDIPQAQLNRLQKAAELIERIQKSGVPDLSGLGALGSAPAGGGGKAVSGGKAGNVNVSLKEADLTKLFRTAAEAAFATPIPGVKLDLDIAHIQQQLTGLKISFTGVNNTQGAPPAGPRPVPPGIREEIGGKEKVGGAIDDMFTAVNVALKRSNQPMLQASNDVASKFTALADALGDTMHKVVTLGEAEGPYGRPVTGGSVGSLLAGAADDVADKLEEAGRTFYERVGRTGLFQAYRAAGGQPAGSGGVTQHQANAPTGQQQQVQLAQMRAAEGQIEANRHVAQQAQMAAGTRSGLPRSIDDINNFATQLAKISGYDVGRAKGNQTRPWEDIQREFVAGRRSYGPRGMTAFGRVGTSQGTDITDLLVAAGPGARALSGFGEVMKEGKPSGQYVSLTPDEQEFLKGQTKRQGAVAGHNLVQQVAPREMLQRLLIANRGVSGEEAKQISEWAMRAGGPLHASGRGDVSGVSLSAMMSGGSTTITNEARDLLRMQRLQGERRDLMTQLAGTGVPAEQRSLRAKIANRAGQINRLQLINAGQGVTGEQNRQMVEEGAIDPLSRHRTAIGDRRSIVTALTNLSQFKGEQDEYQRQIEETRKALLGGYLPQKGEASKVGGMAGTWTQGQALFSEIKQIVNDFRDSIGLPPTKKPTIKSMTAQLEREGFPMESAAISALFGEASNRRGMAEAAISSYPQKTGLIEGKDVGVRSFTRQTELDAAQRRYEQMFGRNASAEHDPFAMGLAGTGWDQRGQLGEKGPMGRHPRVLQGIPSQMHAIKREIEDAVSKEMGLKIMRDPTNERPEDVPLDRVSGQITGVQGPVGDTHNKRLNILEEVQKRMDADPRVQQMRAEQPGLERRIKALQRLARFQSRAQDRGYFRTEAPPVMTGDEMRMKYYESSGMAPMGGVPMSGADIRKRRGFAMTEGSPALTLPGGGSSLGPTILPPEGDGGEGGGGGRATPMGGGGVVHVWIDGPFPLRTSISGGGGAKAIQRAYDEGNIAEGQALNVAEGMARGGTAESGGAVRKGRGKGARVNLDEMRAAEEEKKTAGQAERETRRAAREAAAPKTQRGPASFKEASSMPAGATIEVGPDGEARIVTEAERRNRARAGGRAAREPSAAALAAALSGAGVDPERIAATVGRQSVARRDGVDVQSVIEARQRAREAQAQLPQRALGTTMVQLFQNAFGGREAPTQRVLTFQRELGQVQRLAGGLTVLDTQRRAAGAQRAEQLRTRAGIIQAGGIVPPELDQAIKASTERYRAHTASMRQLEVRVDKAGDALKKMELVHPSDILRNLGAGFIGGIAGGITTMGVSTAIQGVMAVAGLAKEVLQPAYDAAIGYQTQTNKVIDALSDQVRANYGVVDSTVALKAAQAGLGMATYQAIRPQLEQAAGVEAGNKAYGDYIELLRGSRNNLGDTRGLYKTTNGFNALGVQTPFFGTPSTLENFLNQFQGAGFQGFGPNGTQTSTDFFTNFGNNLGTINDTIQGLFGNTGPLQKRAEALANTAPTAIGDVNAEFNKVGANLQLQGGQQGSTGNEAFIRALTRAGADEGQIDQVRSFGLQFTDSAGNVIADLDEIDGALRTWTQALSQLDPAVWLKSQTGPHGALTASVFGLQQQSQLARQQAFGQIALQRLAQPPVRLDEVLAGVQGVPSQFSQRGPGNAPPSAIMRAFQGIGQGAIQTSIAAIGDPAAQQQAQQMLGLLTQAGKEMHALQVEGAQIQMASTFRQMNRDIYVANRQVSDLVGLTGKESATMANGSKIQASDIGILERKNMLLSRSLQLQQFEHQTRSLNYQIALAGFMAEGATGEERAARLEVAQKEAQFQKDQLAGQKQLANNNWQIQQQENDRAFTDAMYQANELVRRLDDTAALQRIDDKIAQWQEVSGAASELLNTYLAQGNGMIQLAQGVAVQLIQMGTAASEAINIATEALGHTVEVLQGIWTKDTIGSSSGSFGDPTTQPTTWTKDNVGSSSGSWGGPESGGGPSVTPMGTSSNGVVQIINPSAGVDTQALVRVVISELNRQAGLRGLTTVGGR